jgi:hypothetical protein
MKCRKGGHYIIEEFGSVGITLQPIDPITTRQLLSGAFTRLNAFEEKSERARPGFTAKKQRWGVQRSRQVPSREFAHRCQRKAVGGILRKNTEAGQRTHYAPERRRADSSRLGHLFESPTIQGADKLGLPKKPYAVATARIRNGASQMVVFLSRERAQVLNLGRYFPLS